jgi:hypothetical protein
MVFQKSAIFVIFWRRRFFSRSLQLKQTALLILATGVE